MKKLSLLFLLLSLLFSCQPEDPIRLEDTELINLSFREPKDSFPANEPILLEVAAYRADNTPITKDPSLFDFYDGDGKLLSSDTLLHAAAGLYNVHAKLKKAQSNTLDYKVYDKDKPARVKLSFSVARDSFLTREPIQLQAAAYRKDSSLITNTLTDFHFLDHNGQTLTPPFQHSQEGDFYVYAVYKNLNSPVVSYQVHDRNKLVDSLSLRTDYYTFIADGETALSFAVDAFIRGEPIDQIDYRLIANGQAIEETFKTTLSGNYIISATVANCSSNGLEVVAKEAKNYSVTEVPVVFHIIHDGEAPGSGYNIAASTIQHELDKLNQTFRKASGTLGDNPNPTGIDARIQFVLAPTDPFGAPLAEPGINRFQRPGSNYSIKFWQEDWMWDVFWDPDFYINIWVGDTKDQYSWGSLPQTYCQYPLEGTGCTDYPEATYKQGIAFNKEHISNNGTTLTHEMGHVLGLGHVFNQATACQEDPDYCDDTPYYNRLAYENNINTYQQQRISCQGIEYLSDNYMDYYHGTRNTFTYEQRERMQHIIRHGRWRAQAASRSNARLQPRQMTRPAEAVDIRHLIIW